MCISELLEKLYVEHAGEKTPKRYNNLVHGFCAEISLVHW